MTETVELPPVETVEDKPVAVVIDDKKAAPSGNAPAPAAPIVTADEGIESLKEQVERAKRESAARLAEKDRQIQAAFAKANEAEREVATVKRDQVGTIIDSLAKDKEAARRDYKLAMEAGDYEKAAEAQDRLSLANARIVEAERGKMALEEEAKKPLPVVPVNDPAEQMAQRLSARSAAWILQHPDFARDPRKTRQMVRAHEDAVDEGYAPDSDDYFGFIETRLGIGQRSEPRQERQNQPNGRDMNRGPTSAPVSRDVPASPGATRPGTVTLSANEVRTAIDTLSPLYPDADRNELLRIYAKNQADLRAEGRIGRGQ